MPRGSIIATGDGSAVRSRWRFGVRSWATSEHSPRVRGRKPCRRAPWSNSLSDARAKSQVLSQSPSPRSGFCSQSAARCARSHATIMQLGAIGLGVRGGPAGEAPLHTAPPKDGAESPVEFSVRAGFASDYIYRGTTLSARQPAVGAAFEDGARRLLRRHDMSPASSCQRQPAAEITMSGGIRPTAGRRHIRLRLDLLFLSRRDAAARRDRRHRILGSVGPCRHQDRRAAARGRRLCLFAERLEHRRLEQIRGVRPGHRPAVPSALPQDVTVSLTGGAGYFWFGNQSAELGGFPLPAYLNWNAGVTFTRKHLQPRSALLRHQSVEGRLLRLHRRSRCHSRRKHRPGAEIRKASCRAGAAPRSSRSSGSH